MNRKLTNEIKNEIGEGPPLCVELTTLLQTVELGQRGTTAVTKLLWSIKTKNFAVKK